METKSCTPSMIQGKHHSLKNYTGFKRTRVLILKYSQEKDQRLNGEMEGEMIGPVQAHSHSLS